MHTVKEDNTPIIVHHHHHHHLTETGPGRREKKPYVKSVCVCTNSSKVREHKGERQNTRSLTQAKTGPPILHRAVRFVLSGIL